MSLSVEKEMDISGFVYVWIDWSGVVERETGTGVLVCGKMGFTSIFGVGHLWVEGERCVCEHVDRES